MDSGGLRRMNQPLILTSPPVLLVTVGVIIEMDQIVRRCSSNKTPVWTCSATLSGTVSSYCLCVYVCY